MRSKLVLLWAVVMLFSSCNSSNIEMKMTEYPLGGGLVKIMRYDFLNTAEDKVISVKILRSYNDTVCYQLNPLETKSMTKSESYQEASFEPKIISEEEVEN